jgi:hypothetical protein
MKKSIAQLKRYKELLYKRIETISKDKENAIISGHLVGAQIDHPYRLEYIDATLDVIALIDNEIDVASMSNTINWGGEEMSLNQAKHCLSSIRLRKVKYMNFRERFFKTSQSSAGLQYTDIESQSKIYFDLVRKAEEEEYSLSDKIAKIEEEILIDVDMAGLTVVLE